VHRRRPAERPWGASAAGRMLAKLASSRVCHTIVTLVPLDAPFSPLEPARVRGGKRPQAQVQAAEEEAPSEWGSLLGDLSRHRAPGSELDVEWRIHDKTHLEFAIDYPFRDGQSEYTWEAYFFVPESFRLAQTTYDKKQIYDDLLSYVRLAVPEIPFEELASACSSEGEPEASAEGASLLADLRRSIEAARGSSDGSEASRLAIRRARVFASVVRASGLDAQRRLLSAIAEAEEPAAGLGAVSAFSSAARRISASFRQLVESQAGESAGLPEELGVALRWVDEDLSLFLETLAAAASIRVQQRTVEDPGWAEVAARLARDAVEQARFRAAKGYPSVGSGSASPREVEHIEFRRHVLKRFTSSVLWLQHEVRDGATWALHGLYAIAAAVAMAFAVIATLRVTQSGAADGYLTLYFFVLVASYAVKDRMKAILQTYFSSWAQRRFADRAWTIRDEERAHDVGRVEESAGFRAFRRLPEGVLEARRKTREHALEEFARPEAVLWHQKHVALEPRRKGTLPSPMMTEIFRLNLGPWLAHTDDPNRTISFADPESAAVCTAKARRVYNLNVVYRLRRAGSDVPWRRIRVVVSRKGIERIDPIG